MITKKATGDAFVDLGRRAILYLAGKDVVEDDQLMEMIQQQTNIYVQSWKSKLNMFYLNSAITQPANKTPESKIKKTMEKFSNAFTGVKDGRCEICGKPAHISTGNRTNTPLAGGSNEVNFHPSFGAGLDVCPDCLAALYFLPVAVLQAGGKILALQTRTETAYDVWIQRTVEQYREALGKGMSTGPEKSRQGTTPNTIYATTVNYVQHAGSAGINGEELTFFSFTNFGASPSVDIITVPHQTLLYLWHLENPQLLEHASRNSEAKTVEIVGSMMGLTDYLASYQELNSAWHLFIRQGMSVRKKPTKGAKVAPDPNDPLATSNRFINKLINGESLLWDMRRLRVPFTLAALYEMEVLGMEQQRIKKLMELGATIAVYEHEHNEQKIVRDLEGAKSCAEFRTAIRRAARRYVEKKGTPLLTANDLTQWIVRDNETWPEARDILLIYLYEQLADMLKKTSAVDEQAEESNEIQSEEEKDE